MDKKKKRNTGITQQHQKAATISVICKQKEEEGVRSKLSRGPWGAKVQTPEERPSPAGADEPSPQKGPHVAGTQIS